MAGVERSSRKKRDFRKKKTYFKSFFQISYVFPAQKEGFGKGKMPTGHCDIGVPVPLVAGEKRGLGRQRIGKIQSFLDP